MLKHHALGHGHDSPRRRPAIHRGRWPPLRANWRSHAKNFILSDAHDNFDFTFTNYSRYQLSAAPYNDLIPPVLHYIALGEYGSHLREGWDETVQSCLD